MGPRAIAEAIRAGQPISKVWVQHKAAQGRLESLIKELKTCGVLCAKVRTSTLQRMAGTRHQGIVAQVAAVAFAALSEVIIRTFEQGKVPLLLVIERCTDVRNVGAMARSAEALGADALVVTQHGTSALGQDTLRASAGALLHIPLCRVSSWEKAFEELKAHGIQLIAATTGATKNCTEIDLSIPVALIVGAEGTGLSPRLLQKADEKVCIPMQGKIESLNVAAAAAILLYEAQRQRK